MKKIHPITRLAVLKRLAETDGAGKPIQVKQIAKQTGVSERVVGSILRQAWILTYDDVKGDLRERLEALQ